MVIRTKIKAIVDKDGKFLGVFIAAEDLNGIPIAISGTKEEWEKAMLPEDSRAAIVPLDFTWG